MQSALAGASTRSSPRPASTCAASGRAGREALTPAERRVAELAASGLTNREIGQTLFVSVKTVGTHLGHIYEKLDLQGPQAREQLAGAERLTPPP